MQPAVLAYNLLRWDGPTFWRISGKVAAGERPDALLLEHDPAAQRTTTPSI
jgi:hypothetical protein